MQSDHSSLTHERSRLGLPEQLRQTGEKSTQSPADKKELDYTTKLSITEQQIQSHSIIKSILDSCRYKVVHHRINTVPPKIQLYRKRNHSNLEVLLKVQSGSDGKRHSSIYNQIMHEVPIKSKMQEYANRNMHRSQSIKENYLSLPYKKSAGIAVSGLISYNFTSVKARHRLVYDTQASEKELTETMGNSKLKATKKVERSEKIRMKTDPILAVQQKQINDAIIGEYSGMNTDDYLNALQRQKENNKFVYGQKLKYLKYLTKSMKTEGTDQSEAEFTINQLKLASRRPTPKHKLIMAYKRGVGHRKAAEEEQSFQCRKLPSKPKKTILTFIQNQ